MSHMVWHTPRGQIIPVMLQKMPEQYDKTSSCIFSDVTLSLSAYRYTFNRYVKVEDVHRGRHHRKDTVRQHALIIGDLRIVAVVVPDGNAGDSPALAEPCARGAPRLRGHVGGGSRARVPGSGG